MNWKSQKEIDADYYRLCELADAKLQVADDFSFTLALGWSIAAHLKWDSWLVTIAVFIFFFWYFARPFRKASEKAWSKYENRPTSNINDDFE